MARPGRGEYGADRPPGAAVRADLVELHLPIGTCVTGTIAPAARTNDQALHWASVILYLVLLAAGPALADYGHDEALGMRPGEPAFVVKPGSSAEVAGVLRIAGEQGLAVTARGSGTGLSGAAIPRPGGLDARTMAVIAQGEDLDLGIPGSVRESAQAYLVVMQEERDPPAGWTPMWPKWRSC